MRYGIRAFAQSNGGDGRRDKPKRESAPVADCINPRCGRPTTGGAYCQRCLDDLQRTVCEMGLDEPPDQSDQNLVCAMKMSIIAITCERAREKEDAER